MLPWVLGYSALCLHCVRQGVWYSGQWNRRSFLRDEMSAVAEWVLQSWVCNFVLSKVIFKMYKRSMNYMTTRTKGPYFGNERAFHPEAGWESMKFVIWWFRCKWITGPSSNKELNLRYVKSPKSRSGEHTNNRKSSLSKFLIKLTAFHFAENSLCNFLIHLMKWFELKKYFLILNKIELQRK